MDIAAIDERIAEAEAALSTMERRRLEVAAGIGLALGRPTEYALVDHYVSGVAVEAIARAQGVHRSTVWRWMSTAFDYVAAVGIAVAERGGGLATSDVYGRHDATD